MGLETRRRPWERAKFVFDMGTGAIAWAAVAVHVTTPAHDSRSYAIANAAVLLYLVGAIVHRRAVRRARQRPGGA